MVASVPALKRVARGLVNLTLPYFDPLWDIGLLARFTVTNPRPHTKHLQLRKVAKRTLANVLIETGTFQGLTASRMAKYFERVYTVELDEKLAAAARQRLRPLENVVCDRADAATWLPKVLEECWEDRVLVYCDAHFSGGATTSSEQADPVILELDVLERFQKHVAAIVIDDFRCFGVEHAYPSKADVVAAAERFCRYGFTVSVHLDQILIERSAS